MKQQRSRRRAQDIIVIAAALGAAFCLGHLAAGPGGSGGAAWAGPPARGFPVDAGRQRKEMVEELRAIRRLLEADSRPSR